MRMTKAALDEGKCVVIGLQSTGEARTADVVAERGEELDDFVSGPRVRRQAYPPTHTHTHRERERERERESVGVWERERGVTLGPDNQGWLVRRPVKARLAHTGDFANFRGPWSCTCQVFGFHVLVRVNGSVVA